MNDPCFRSPKSQDLNTTSDLQRNKRKQFVPQQHGNTINGDIDVVTADDTEVKQPLNATDDGEELESNQSTTEERKENVLLKNQIKIMSEQLQKNQQ